MLSRFKILFKYLKYYITASNGKGHGIHSHFVFNLVKKVFNDDRTYYAFNKIEKLRKELLDNQSIVFVEDFGAGSIISKGTNRTIASIARLAAKPAKYGQLFFRLVNYFKAYHILELGTSLGISTAYFASADAKAKVITMEGSSAIADKAGQHFQQLGLNNISLVQGNFDDTLSDVLKTNPSFDLVFFDGNHRKDPTISYFKQCLLNAHSDSIFIFDDIHWSDEMEAAWNEIKAHPSVTCSIDLFFVGLVFFRKEFKEKLHYTIRF